MTASAVARILVVDDESSIRQVVSTIIKTKGYDVETADDGETALEKLAESSFDVVLSDVRMERMDGITLLGKAQELYPDVTFVMLTAYSSIDTAMLALKNGAFDYLSKPFKVDEMLDTVERALEYHKLKASRGKPHVPEQQERSSYYFDDIIAESLAMKGVCDMIRRIAPTESPALITGESGTGKELVAKAIHKNSKRKDASFLTINCAELPEPLLQVAIFGSGPGEGSQGSMLKKCEGGTLLLEEIEDLPLSIQDDLLALIQNKTPNAPDVRIIASSNAPLTTDVGAGKFRAALQQRLTTIILAIPPLRERREDILPVAIDILATLASDDSPMKRLDSEVLQIIQAYDWPGNGRELKNVLTSITDTISEQDITKAHLPPKIAATHTPTGDADAMLEATRGKELRRFLKEKAGLGKR